ncbi:5-formyltetrahydrofolate cyclo-ligase [Zhaonella formicivorans]|uniref:5-formyltetrahydrofolate cyclo-ligase n=1 Tax=Zhaonella formicivorans TaxID=2528593 RepID=UPI001D122774|nr:5-formyltetrahydrofolate cyclo-ligase [Zhaonella formicivorans]
MKKELRRRIMAERQALSQESVQEKSSIIARQVVALNEFKQAMTVMAYLAFRNEVDTGQIITRVLAGGKRLLIPVSDRKEVKIIPAEIKNYPGDLVPGAYGILEPKPELFCPVAPEEIDLVLIPGVAFDEQGNRLGYGAGYYDRFLERLRPEVLKVALAFELQITDQVYAEPHDKKVDLIITEKRIIKCRGF